ncbi:ABC transporter C member 7 [Ranunculus cassubicifolius]
MQKTLRQHFSGSTVITIAHRITSVLDSDMVLVLDNGHALEYDSPKDLFPLRLQSWSLSMLKLQLLSLG